MTNVLKNQMLTEAYQSFAPELSRYAYFKIQDSELSQDLVQTTFMKTWQYLQRGGEIHLMRAFLYHALNCLVVDEYRKHKTVSLEFLAEEGFEPQATNLEESILRSIEGKRVVVLLEKLPEKYSRVIKMRFIKGLSFEEMSRITAESKNTMAVQVHRGLAKLKQMHAESVA